jgi:hypothetical protein
MPSARLYHNKEELAQRGNEIYNREIRPQVEALNKGKFIAIDIGTGAWEMDVDALTACDRLNTRIRNSQTWLIRIGYPSIHRIGGPRRVLEQI